jgi:hypothetical protein
LKKTPSDASLTIGELKSMTNSTDCFGIMMRISAFSANITGSDSYWFKRRQEIEATFEQKEPATIFFTFSYADNHWCVLHRLMPGINIKRLLKILKNLNFNFSGKKTEDS